MFIPSRDHACTGQWELFAPSRGHMGEGVWARWARGKCVGALVRQKVGAKGRREA